MERTTPGEESHAFDGMWEEHLPRLRQLLLSMSRDRDVAEDLLQEAYVRASDGFASYRGENAKAWLTAIARNAFLAYARRKRTRAEQPLDHELEDHRPLQIGSSGYLALLSLRHALPGLREPFRTALLMRHYGGFSYREIAAQMGCPVGTAKRRVWTAMQRLRAAIGEEVTEMRCEGLKGTLMLDYLYGALSGGEAEKVQSHLNACGTCRREAEELGNVVGMLDAAIRLRQRYAAISPAADTIARPMRDRLIRLMERIAQIFVAEKSVLMRLDAESRQIVATTPACGFTDDELAALRIDSTEGVLGRALREFSKAGLIDGSQPIEAALRRLGVRDGVCTWVGRLGLDEAPLGLLCVFNKKAPHSFVEEDAQMLHRMARECAAIFDEAHALSDTARREVQLEEMIADFLETCSRSAISR